MNAKLLLTTILFAAALGVPAAEAADKLKLGMPSKSYLNLPEFAAQEKGIYAKHGLDIEFVPIADSSIPVRSLIAGDIDLIETGMSETLAATDKGADLRTIGGIHTGLHYAFYVNAAAGISDVKDLPGKKVGISSPGSLPHVVITALMREAGMSSDQIKSVQWVQLKGTAARISGTINGTIAATVAGYDPKAAVDPNVKVLFVVSKRMPDYVMTPWDVRADALKTKRDLLVRFVKAELEAVRWVMDNKAEATAIAKKHFDYSEDQLADFYAFYKDGGIWNPNGTVTAQQAKYMQELNVEGGLQRQVLPTDKVLDTSPLEAALAELGKYPK